MVSKATEWKDVQGIQLWHSAIFPVNDKLSRKLFRWALCENDAHVSIQWNIYGYDQEKGISQIMITINIILLELQFYHYIS